MAAYAALISVMHIIDDLEHHPDPPIFLNKNQVYRLTQKITFLQEFLEGYNPHLNYSAEADPLEARISHAAYAAEDVIETHIVDHITNDEENISSDDVFYDAVENFIESHIVDSITSDEEKISSDEVFYEAVEKVIEEMALIEKEAKEIKLETVGLQHDRLHTKSTPSDSSIPSSSIAQKSSMVGADELLLEMKDKLTSHRLDLQIISIVGMGGSGKTTLATNIYQDRLIKEHFYICAWITISQEYSIRDILEQLLKQLSAGRSQDLSEGVLGEMLHKHLFGRKYLIVLDDMWSIRAWDGVRMFLPNNTNGSRIVVTTRLSNLASQLPNSSTLKMNLLDEDYSWDLLSKTVFGEKDCPLEFEEIGKKIGKSCKGLPLSIVVVGGLLAKSTHTREFWEYIKENLNSVVNLEDDERYFKILYMSYKQLPVHLKPCFLYMGVFPEDKVIRISKLIKLWVAEGFLKPISKKSMEEIAKECLEDLICRNLILIHKLAITGKIKECKIHDLLRDLCLREAEKERFYTVVASPPSPQQIVNAAQRRIVVSSSTSMDEAINALLSMPLARSLIWNIEDKELPPLNLMRLLRILESSFSFSNITETCLKSMHQLVNSRYINISGFRCHQSIGRFWNLQTFYCELWYSHEATFIWDMIQIRHIHSDEHMDLNTDIEFQGDNVLGNLQTLGRLSNFKCSKEIVKRIPNIKKLAIRYYEPIYDDRYCLNNFVCLDKLESLTCSFRIGSDSLQRLISFPQSLSCCVFYQIRYQSGSHYSLERLINFPNSLIKLTLRVDLEQCWEDILDKIGALPLLQKLTLCFGNFKGKWETTEGQFRSLKFLSLWECEGLLVWITESSHFPCLEHLVLHQVTGLKEIPLEFAEISTLSVIELALSGASVIDSAKRILESREELYGEATVQVRVKLWSMTEEQERTSTPNLRYSQYRF